MSKEITREKLYQLVDQALDYTQSSFEQIIPKCQIDSGESRLEDQFENQFETTRYLFILMGLIPRDEDFPEDGDEKRKYESFRLDVIKEAEREEAQEEEEEEDDVLRAVREVARVAEEGAKAAKELVKVTTAARARARAARYR